MITEDPVGRAREPIADPSTDDGRLELELPRGRPSRSPPPASPSSARAVLPPPGDESFEALATPVSGRGRMPSSEDLDLDGPPPSRVGQEASLAPPPLVPPEPEPPRARSPRASSPAFEAPPPRAIAERAAPPEREPPPPSMSPEGRNLAQVLRLPVGLIVAGLVVMAVDRGAAESFSGSPIRPIWVSMTLLIVGLGMVFWRLLAIDSEH